jgi:hypothetical protein
LTTGALAAPDDATNAAPRLPRAPHREQGAGRLSGREEARIASTLKNVERAYARFAKAKPFW